MEPASRTNSHRTVLKNAVQLAQKKMPTLSLLGARGNDGQNVGPTGLWAPGPTAEHCRTAPEALAASGTAPPPCRKCRPECSASRGPATPPGPQGTHSHTRTARAAPTGATWLWGLRHLWARCTHPQSPKHTLAPCLMHPENSPDWPTTQELRAKAPPSHTTQGPREHPTGRSGLPLPWPDTAHASLSEGLSPEKGNTGGEV